MSQGVEQRLGFLAAQVSIDKTKLTKEMLEMALKCKTPEELIALAKAEGFEITKDEAEAYFAELADVELDEKALRNIAGGTCTLEGTSCWTLST
jgi:predicted ribosomally synthesized peptide with nif11-like leader